MDVAPDAHDTGPVEELGLGLAGAGEGDLEALRLGDGKDLVIDAVLIGKRDAGADDDGGNVGRKFLFLLNNDCLLYTSDAADE